MVRLRRPSPGLGLSGGSADCFVSGNCEEVTPCPGANRTCEAEEVSGDAEVVTLGERLLNSCLKKRRRIYFAMIVDTSFQLLELDRVSRRIHIGLMSVPSIARIGLTIGFVASICDFLSITGMH